MSKISELVTFALTDQTGIDTSIRFGTISNMQAQRINEFSYLDVKGGEKILTARGIRHAFSGHGNITLEDRRGQIAIQKNDFELLPEILLNPDLYLPGNKNRNGRRSAVVFVKYFNQKAYCVVMAEERGDLVFATMYIKKNKADVRTTSA